MDKTCQEPSCKSGTYASQKKSKFSSYAMGQIVDFNNHNTACGQANLMSHIMSKVL